MKTLKAVVAIVLFAACSVWGLKSQMVIWDGGGVNCANCGPVNVDGTNFYWCCNQPCDVGCGPAIEEGDLVKLYCTYNVECGGNWE
jgi:hypothetical protein